MHTPFVRSTFVLGLTLALHTATATAQSAPPAQAPTTDRQTPSPPDTVLRLGRVDVNVQGDAPPPGVTVLGEDDVHLFDAPS